MRAGAAALSREWGATAPVTSVRIDHPDRAVFDTRAPGGEAVVVKVDTDQDRGGREHRALGLAHRAGIAVPVVVAARPGPPAVLALSLVPGTPLDEVTADAAWVAAGGVLGSLRRVGWSGGREQGWTGQLRGMLDEARGHDAVLETVTGDTIEAVAAEVAALPTPTLAFTHGDASPQHLLWSGTGVTLIDFGDAGPGDPAWDLAVLTLHHLDRLPAVLSGYGAGATFRAHVAAVLPTYQAVRLLGAVAWLADHGFGAAREAAELAERGFTRRARPPR